MGMFRRAIHSLALVSALSGCGGSSPAAPTLVIPTLVTPVIGALLPNGCFDFSRQRVWDFDWSDVPGATAYHLYVIGPTATNPVIDIEQLSASSYRSTSTGWNNTLDGWQWRVRARVGGTFRDWSETRTFSVDAPNRGC